MTIALVEKLAQTQIARPQCNRVQRRTACLKNIYRAMTPKSPTSTSRNANPKKNPIAGYQWQRIIQWLMVLGGIGLLAHSTYRLTRSPTPLETKVIKDTSWPSEDPLRSQLESGYWVLDDNQFGIGIEILSPGEVVEWKLEQQSRLSKTKANVELDLGDWTKSSLVSATNRGDQVFYELELQGLEIQFATRSINGNELFCGGFGIARSDQRIFAFQLQSANTDQSPPSTLAPLEDLANVQRIASRFTDQKPIAHVCMTSMNSKILVQSLKKNGWRVFQADDETQPQVIQMNRRNSKRNYYLRPLLVQESSLVFLIWEPSVNNNKDVPAY